jgi:phenylacetate-CoA ligase
MGFFHLHSPSTASRNAIWAAYRELDRTQWLSAEQLRESQFKELEKLLRHCFEHVPYYRRVLGEVGFPGKPIQTMEDLRRIPLLSRELYQANFEDIQARQLPTGMKVSGKGSFTSGTNGVPIKVLKTNRDVLCWNAFFLRDLEWSGIDPRGRLAAIRLMAMSKEELPGALAGKSSACWRDFCPSLFENGPSFTMDIRQDARRQLEWLREIKPDYLLSLPTNLEFLAGLVRESGEKLPGLRLIQAMGEMLTDDVKGRIEAGFGVPVKNLYSTTECGYIASPCPSGTGLHVHSENVLIEVLDAQDRPCERGESGRLVFTSLHNFITPFIRYDIVDEVTLAEKPCACGRASPLLSRIDGRRHPMLHLPDGRRKSSMGITLGIRQVGGVHQFQIVQRAVDHVVLRVVADGSWQESHAAGMRRVVNDEFESAIRVDVEPMQSISRPAGGKLKIVLIEMDARHRT